jgi:uncharacterized protein YdgA (DUF945 family)
MKYFITMVCIVLGCLMIILTGCAYWIGLETEQLAQTPQPGLKINDIDRGWFSSEANSQLLIDSPALLVQRLALHHKIYHGPLPLSGWPLPALVMIKTTIAPQMRQLQWIEPTSEQELLTIESRVAFDQSIRHNIHIAPARLSRPQGKVDSLVLDGSLDGWLETAASGQLTAGGLQLGRLEFNNRTDGIAFKLGQLNMTLAQADDSYRLELDVTLDKLQLQQEPAGPGNLRLSIESLNQQALMQLTQTLSQQADQILLLQTLLRHRPHVVLHELHLQTARGQLDASADLTLREFSLLQLFSPLGLPGAALQQAAAVISVDRNLMEWIIPQPQLSRWRDAGFVRLENQVYHCRIQLQDDHLQINDNHLTLP